MEVQLAHESAFTEYVENIEYDAKGQRTDIFYGNGSKTRYDYDYFHLQVLGLGIDCNAKEGIGHLLPELVYLEDFKVQWGY